MRKFVDSLISEMRQSFLEERPGDYENTEKSLVRATSRKIIDKMDGTTNERVRSKRLKKSLKSPATDTQNPDQKELDSLASGYNVWGATGLNGDGYALEEGKFKDFCVKCLKKKIRGQVHNCMGGQQSDEMESSGEGGDGGGE